MVGNAGHNGVICVSTLAAGLPDKGEDGGGKSGRRFEADLPGPVAGGDDQRKPGPHLVLGQRVVVTALGCQRQCKVPGWIGAGNDYPGRPRRPRPEQGSGIDAVQDQVPALPRGCDQDVRDGGAAVRCHLQFRGKGKVPHRLQALAQAVLEVQGSELAAGVGGGHGPTAEGQFKKHPRAGR